MATYSSTLAWKIPWMEEPGRLQSMGSLKVGHDWTTSLSLFTFMHWRRKWQPTPVFLLGESQGWRSLVGSVYGVAQSWTRLKQLSSSSSSSSSQIHNGQCRERGGQSTEKVFWFSNFYCHAIKKNTFISHYMLVLLWNHRFFKYLIWFNSVKLLFLPILKLYH